MERLCDVFDHPHELVVREGWGHALCHKVVNGHRGITETERKHCWGTLCGVFQREGFPSSEPCHDVGVREGEAVWVLPKWLGS